MIRLADVQVLLTTKLGHFKSSGSENLIWKGAPLGTACYGMYHDKAKTIND